MAGDDKEMQASGAGRYEELRSLVESVLRRHDPIRLISIGAPPGEYDPEIGTILPRLGRVSSSSEVQRVLHEEFTNWFGAEQAGSSDLYEGAAEEIWRGWLLLEAQRLSSDGDVELIDPNEVAVRFGSEALHAATIVRIAGRFFVETEAGPGKWWMGERHADGEVAVWGQYGSHDRAFVQH